MTEHKKMLTLAALSSSFHCPCLRCGTLALHEACDAQVGLGQGMGSLWLPGLAGLQTYRLRPTINKPGLAFSNRLNKQNNFVIGENSTDRSRLPRDVLPCLCLSFLNPITTFTKTNARHERGPVNSHVD